MWDQSKEEQQKQDKFYWRVRSGLDIIVCVAILLGFAATGVFFL